MVNNSIKLNKMVKISFLAAVAVVLMTIDFPLPIFPAFLKIDLSDVPAIVGAFTLGPLSGVIVEFIKVFLYALIKGTSTAMVGEVANFLVGGSLVLVTGLIYQKGKTRKSAIIGLFAGSITMTIVAAIANYYFMLPAYVKFMGMTMEQIVSMGTVVNSSIVDPFTLVLLGITPFNLFKCLLVSVVTMVLFNKVIPILSHLKDESAKGSNRAA